MSFSRGFDPVLNVKLRNFFCHEINFSLEVRWPNRLPLEVECFFGVVHFKTGVASWSFAFESQFGVELQSYASLSNLIWLMLYAWVNGRHPVYCYAQFIGQRFRLTEIGTFLFYQKNTDDLNYCRTEVISHSHLKKGKTQCNICRCACEVNGADSTKEGRFTSCFYWEISMQSFPTRNEKKEETFPSKIKTTCFHD